MLWLILGLPFLQLAVIFKWSLVLSRLACLCRVVSSVFLFLFFLHSICVPVCFTFLFSSASCICNTTLVYRMIINKDIQYFPNIFDCVIGLAVPPGTRRHAEEIMDMV